MNTDIFNGFFNDKRVLVTGHTGFKGAWLSLWLKKLGAITTGYSLKPPSNPNFFDICALKDQMISVEGDVKDKKHLNYVFLEYQPQIVIHMAAQSLVKNSYRDPVNTYETNVMGTVNVLEECRNCESVRAILIITSDKCYKNSGYPETGFKESDPMGGYDPYSSSKGCAELVCEAYLKSYFNPDGYQDHNVALASARAGNIIGGGDWAQDRLIPDCIRAFVEHKPVCIRYPEAIRPWQYMLEPLFGYLKLAKSLFENGAAFSGGWNFGPENENLKPVKWIIEKMVRLWNDNAGWQIDEASHSYESPCLKLDCKKAKSLLDWNPRMNLETALANTIGWYKAYYDNNDIIGESLQKIENYEKSLKKMDLVL